MDQGTSANSKAGATIKESQTLEHETPGFLVTPPPSYPEVQSQTPVADQNPPSREKPAYPPHAHHTQAPSVMLHVRYESWRTSDIHILGADNATTLYTLKLHLRKPQMIINSASTNATIATVTFPSFSSRIDTTVHGSPIALTSRGLLKNGHTWSSPALGNMDLAWKTKALSSDLECLDEQGVPVARYVFPHMSLRKAGRFELYGPEVTRGAVMEEILVMGLAMVEYNLRNQQM